MDWPSTLVAYRRTEDLTAETAPADVLAGALSDGQWALIRVRTGALHMVDLAEARTGELNPNVPGFLEPGVAFELVPSPDAVFYVEYYRDASAELEEE